MVYDGDSRENTRKEHGGQEEELVIPAAAGWASLLLQDCLVYLFSLQSEEDHLLALGVDCLSGGAGAWEYKVCMGEYIRLAGSGLTQCSGRVEIYHNNIWGTICDDGWDLNAAEVVCRQLNCGPVLEAHQNAYFGEGTGEIWLDEVTCSGSEDFLTDCPNSGFGNHDCDHSEDASVICSDALSEGVTPSEKVGSWRKFLVKVNLAAVDSSVDMKDPAVMESVMNSIKNELRGTADDLKVSWWKRPEKKDIKKQEACTP
ncbi:neurotrypsin-like [Haplochromis burtoni]|uniref:neurotrypsin-like n=1 Tax=Haplochromis burtoni TaxID=8153 RepID=UPI001C2CC850|nr:neurotrypsin-like [Haplochromis burtoni]